MIFEPVRIAVIGTEGYSWQLIKRLMTVPHFGVVAAVTSLDATGPQARLCRQWGIPIFTSLDAMLAAGTFEVVINSTPIHLHARLTEQCLAAGVAVWLEKPPVATIQDFDQLQKSAAAHNTAISVGFNSLYSHLTQNLKADLVGGRFGTVRRVKGIGAWIRPRSYFARNDWAGRLRKDGDWILDGDLNNAFAHVLCNNLYFAAPTHHALAKPIEVEAELYRCNDIESEDTSCVRIRTREEVEILTYLTLSPRQEIPPTTLIETEKAQITFEDFKRVRINFHDGSVEEHEAYQEDRIEMLQHLCRTFRNGESYLGNLSMMRPFTEAVNGAFDSTETVHAIPPEYLDTNTDAKGPGPRVSIRGIEHIMNDAFASNSLYAELGVPWATKSRKFDTSNYALFPARFQENGSRITK